MVGENIDRDIGKILQKLEDQDGWLVNIDKKLTYTNGKIAQAMQDLAIVKEKQETCPALKDHNKNDSIPNLTKMSLILSIIVNIVLVASKYIKP